MRAGQLLAKAIPNAIERHLIREENSRAGHLLELLMNNIPDSIYFKDKASRFVMINRTHAKRFGLADLHLAVGKSDADFFTSDHAQQALADEQRFIQTSGCRDYKALATENRSSRRSIAARGSTPKRPHCLVARLNICLSRSDPTIKRTDLAGRLSRL